MLEPLETRALLSAATTDVDASITSALAPTETEALEAALVQQQAKKAAKSLVGSLSSLTPITTSTIPANGDLNPYGTAFVPKGFPTGGSLNPGDLLVSNFNNANNLQGTGTTIVRVTPDGQTSTFFQGSADLGLTTVLGVLKKGYVIVGNLPTLDGTGTTAQPGSLMILDKNGNIVTTFAASSLIQGPWDMAINDKGSSANLFVSNALTGAISRLDLKISDTSVSLKSITEIASGYAHRTDPSALLLGPTGLVFHNNKLYVASTDDNAVYVIKNAARRQTDDGIGKVAIQDNDHLHGPLGMTLTPDGHLIIANGDAINPDTNQPSTLVEYTTSGRFISQFSIDASPSAPFGIAITSDNSAIRFAAVDNNDNMVSIWTLPRKR